MTVEGELTAAEAERGWAEIITCAAGCEGAGPLRLDLTHLDLPDGVSVAAGITAKIGSLHTAGLRLEDVRADEPTTAN